MNKCTNDVVSNESDESSDDLGIGALLLEERNGGVEELGSVTTQPHNVLGQEPLGGAQRRPLQIPTIKKLANVPQSKQ